MTSNIIILKPNGLPNDEFEDDDSKNELDKTVLAKFLLRQIIKNNLLREYFFELGFHEENDFSYLDQGDWLHIYELITDKEYKDELKELLQHLDIHVYLGGNKK